MYGMKTRGLRGTLARIYQELHVERSAPPATSRTCATQLPSASAWALVVLVADGSVKAHLGRVFVLAQEHLPEVASRLRVEDAVGEERVGREAGPHFD